MAGPVTEASLSWVGGTLFEAEGGDGARLQIDLPVAKGGARRRVLTHAAVARGARRLHVGDGRADPGEAAARR